MAKDAEERRKRNDPAYLAEKREERRLRCTPYGEQRNGPFFLFRFFGEPLEVRLKPEGVAEKLPPTRALGGVRSKLLAFSPSVVRGLMRPEKTRMPVVNNPFVGLSESTA